VSIVLRHDRRCAPQLIPGPLESSAWSIQQVACESLSESAFHDCLSRILTHQAGARSHFRARLRTPMAPSAVNASTSDDGSGTWLNCRLSKVMALSAAKLFVFDSNRIDAIPPPPKGVRDRRNILKDAAT